MKHPTHICRNCLSQVQPKRETPGSFLVELILWLMCLLPGLIYSLWRLSSRKIVCPACRSEQLVPLNSPAATVLLKESGLSLQPPLPIRPAATFHDRLKSWAKAE